MVRLAPAILLIALTGCLANDSGSDPSSSAPTAPRHQATDPRGDAMLTGTGPANETVRQAIDLTDLAWSLEGDLNLTLATVGPPLADATYSCLARTGDGHDFSMQWHQGRPSFHGDRLPSNGSVAWGVRSVSFVVPVPGLAAVAGRGNLTLDCFARWPGTPQWMDAMDDLLGPAIPGSKVDLHIGPFLSRSSAAIDPLCDVEPVPGTNAASAPCDPRIDLVQAWLWQDDLNLHVEVNVTGREDFDFVLAYAQQADGPLARVWTIVHRAGDNHATKGSLVLPVTRAAGHLTLHIPWAYLEDRRSPDEVDLFSAVAQAPVGRGTGFVSDAITIPRYRVA
jgi:hypothetical protein